MMAAGVAALVAGCSDATRFSSDPFGDPFQRSASTRVDRAPTGSISRPRPASAAQTAAVEQRPLPAPTSQSASAAPAPSAGSYNHWTATGGTPIVVGQGETPNVIANRYGVPQEALLRVNGYTSASQVKQGANIVIPVYHAGAAPAAVARAEPPAASEAKSAPRKPAREEAEAEAPAKRDKRVEAKPPKKPEFAARAKKEQDDVDQPAAQSTKGKAMKTALRDDAKKANDDKSKAKQKFAKARDDEEDAAPAKAKLRAPKVAAAPNERGAPRQQVAEAEAPRPRVVQPVQREEARVAASEERPLAPPPARAQPKVAANDPAPSREIDHNTTATIAAPAEKPADDRPEFRWPAKGRIIQAYSGGGGNDGINISVPEGTPVKAAEGGVVTYVGNELKGYGNLVLIRHPNGFSSAYAHNGEIDVKRGDKVSRGQTIAKSGQTGNVVSPQLHFELRKGTTPVNPTEYLAGL